MFGIDFIKKHLSLGDISFLEKMGSTERKFFVQMFNRIEIHERKRLLAICFDSLKTFFPAIAFQLVCFLEEYESFCIDYLEKDSTVFTDYHLFHDFLGTTQWSVTYVMCHLNELLANNEENVFSCLQYAIYQKNISLLNQLILNEDMHIRGLVFLILVPYFSSFLSNIMSHITDYFISLEGKLIEEEIVSKLATIILNEEIGEDIYIQVRDFIFNHYETNHLAFYLDQLSNNNPHIKERIIQDIHLLYEKSCNYKWVLYKKYAPYIDINLCKQDILRVKPFYLLSGNYFIEHMCLHEMTDSFLALSNKYLEKSVGAKTVTSAGVGSCAYAFKIGDYVIKYSTKKYSLEKDFPKIFLILKNIEEVIKRDKNGCVLSAIEVQKYLSRPVESARKDLLDLYRQELDRLGFILNDTLVDGTCGVNCFYLDDYHDADCDNPEELPDWFKKDPIVLVDRDLVIPKKKLQLK